MSLHLKLCQNSPKMHFRDNLVSSYQVSQDCPEFESAYKNIEQSLMCKVSSLRVIFDRTAVLYLNHFIQSVLVG